MTHACPANNCEIQVPYSQLACRQHWYRIPKPLRDELWQAYRHRESNEQRHDAAVRDCTAALLALT